MAEHMAELHSEGRATFAGLVTDGEARLDRIFQAVPALGELAVGTVYGHLHARRTLDPLLRRLAAETPGVELLAGWSAVGLLGDIGLPMSERCLFPSFNGAALTEVFPWGTIRSPTSASNLATARSLSHEEQRAVSDDAKVMIDALDYTGFLERA